MSAFSFSAAGARSPLTLDALARDGYGMVPIRRPEPNDLLVSATVNGRNLSLILDTGFGGDGISVDDEYLRSHLPTNAATGHGHSATGKEVTVRKGTAATIVLGNVQITDVPLFVGTFQGLRNQELRQSVRASGFLGVGFLKTNSAIVDLQNLRLYLRPPRKGRHAVLGPALKAAGLSEAPFLIDRQGQCLVDVEVNGAPGKMVIDTGAFLTGIDTRFASQIKTFGYDRGVRMIDVAGAARSTDVASMKSFKIGGVPVRAPALTLNTFGFYAPTGGKVIGLLGMDLLGQNWGIIDFGQQKLYFAKAP